MKVVNFDAVIFDLDGTLIDTQYDLGFYINKTMRNHGCPEINMNQMYPKSSLRYMYVLYFKNCIE